MKITMLGVLVTAYVTVAAQRPPAPFQNLNIQVHENTEDDVGGFLQAEDGQTTMKWKVYKGVNLDSVVSHTLPFDRHAGGARMTKSFFVVCGFNSQTGEGVIEWLFLSRTHPYQVVSIATETYADINPVAFAWDAKHGRAYIWAADGNLYSAPMPIGATPPARSRFSNPLTPIVEPALSSPFGGSYRMWTRNDGINLTPVSISHRKGTTENPRLIVRFAPGMGWLATPWSTRDMSSAALEDTGYSILHASYVPVAGPLRVKGPGGPFELFDVDSSNVVFTGILPDAPQWWRTDDDNLTTWNTLFFDQNVLKPGNLYQIRHVASGKLSVNFLPLIRYGAPSTINEQGLTWRMQRGQANGWQSVIGNNEFGVTGHLGVSPSGQSREVHFYLNIAFRNPDGSDPVAPVGSNGQYLLTSISGMIGPTIVSEFDSDQVRWPLANSIPIPSDPALAGTVLLFQHVAITSNVALVSDIFGVCIGDDSGIALDRTFTQQQVESACADLCNTAVFPKLSEPLRMTEQMVQDIVLRSMR